MFFWEALLSWITFPIFNDFPVSVYIFAAICSVNIFRSIVFGKDSFTGENAISSLNKIHSLSKRIHEFILQNVQNIK